MNKDIPKLVFNREDALKVIGVAPEGTEDDIRVAFKRLALQWHPDRHNTEKDKDYATQRFIEIHDAYDILMGKSDRRPRLSDVDKRRPSSTAAGPPPPSSPAPAPPPPPGSSSTDQVKVPSPNSSTRPIPDEDAPRHSRTSAAPGPSSHLSHHNSAHSPSHTSERPHSHVSQRPPSHESARPAPHASDRPPSHVSARPQSHASAASPPIHHIMPNPGFRYSTAPDDKVPEKSAPHEGNQSVIPGVSRRSPAFRYATMPDEKFPIQSPGAVHAYMAPDTNEAGPSGWNGGSTGPSPGPRNATMPEDTQQKPSSRSKHMPAPGPPPPTPAPPRAEPTGTAERRKAHHERKRHAHPEGERHAHPKGERHPHAEAEPQARSAAERPSRPEAERRSRSEAKGQPHSEAERQHPPAAERQPRSDRERRPRAEGMRSETDRKSRPHRHRDASEAQRTSPQPLPHPAPGAPTPSSPPEPPFETHVPFSDLHVHSRPASTQSSIPMSAPLSQSPPVHPTPSPVPRSAPLPSDSFFQGSISPPRSTGSVDRGVDHDRSSAHSFHTAPYAPGRVSSHSSDARHSSPIPDFYIPQDSLPSRRTPSPPFSSPPHSSSSSILPPFSSPPVIPESKRPPNKLKKPRPRAVDSLVEVFSPKMKTKHHHHELPRLDTDLPAATRPRAGPEPPILPSRSVSPTYVMLELSRSESGDSFLEAGGTEHKHDTMPTHAPVNSNIRSKIPIPPRCCQRQSFKMFTNYVNIDPSSVPPYPITPLSPLNPPSPPPQLPPTPSSVFGLLPRLRSRDELKAPPPPRPKQKEWIFPLNVTLEEIYHGSTQTYQITQPHTTLTDSPETPTTMAVQVMIPRGVQPSTLLPAGPAFPHILFSVNPVPHPYFKILDPMYGHLWMIVELPWSEAVFEELIHSGGVNGGRKGIKGSMVGFTGITGEEMRVPIPHTADEIRSALENGTRVPGGGLPIVSDDGEVMAYGDLVIRWTFIVSGQAKVVEGIKKVVSHMKF